MELVQEPTLRTNEIVFPNPQPKQSAVEQGIWRWL